MDEPVFSPEEQAELSRHKYIGVLADITKEELAGLLFAFGEWSLRCSEPEPIRDELRSNPGYVRYMIAQNALISFSRNRFTREEYRRHVRAELGIVEEDSAG